MLILNSYNVAGTVFGGGFNCKLGIVNSENPEGMWNKVRIYVYREPLEKSQVVAHLDLIEKTVLQTKDMEKIRNETMEIGVNKNGEESSGVDEPDNGYLTEPQFLRWNGLSQSWEPIKGSDN